MKSIKKVNHILILLILSSCATKFDTTLSSEKNKSPKRFIANINSEEIIERVLSKFENYIDQTHISEYVKDSLYQSHITPIIKGINHSESEYTKLAYELLALRWVYTIDHNPALNVFHRVPITEGINFVESINNEFQLKALKYLLDEDIVFYYSTNTALLKKYRDTFKNIRTEDDLLFFVSSHRELSHIGAYQNHNFKNRGQKKVLKTSTSLNFDLVNKVLIAKKSTFINNRWTLRQVYQKLAGTPHFPYTDDLLNINSDEQIKVLSFLNERQNLKDTELLRLCQFIDNPVQAELFQLMITNNISDPLAYSLAFQKQTDFEKLKELINKMKQQVSSLGYHDFKDVFLNSRSMKFDHKITFYILRYFIDENGIKSRESLKELSKLVDSHEKFIVLHQLINRSWQSYGERYTYYQIRTVSGTNINENRLNKSLIQELVQNKSHYIYKVIKDITELNISGDYYYKKLLKVNNEEEANSVYLILRKHVDRTRHPIDRKINVAIKKAWNELQSHYTKYPDIDLGHLLSYYLDNSSKKEISLSKAITLISSDHQLRALSILKESRDYISDNSLIKLALNIDSEEKFNALKLLVRADKENLELLNYAQHIDSVYSLDALKLFLSSDKLTEEPFQKLSQINSPHDFNLATGKNWFIENGFGPIEKSKTLQSLFTKNDLNDEHIKFIKSLISLDVENENIFEYILKNRPKIATSTKLFLENRYTNFNLETFLSLQKTVVNSKTVNFLQSSSNFQRYIKGVNDLKRIDKLLEDIDENRVFKLKHIASRYSLTFEDLQKFSELDRVNIDNLYTFYTYTKRKDYIFNENFFHALKSIKKRAHIYLFDHPEIQNYLNSSSQAAKNLEDLFQIYNSNSMGSHLQYMINLLIENKASVEDYIDFSLTKKGQVFNEFSSTLGLELEEFSLRTHEAAAVKKFYRKNMAKLLVGKDVSTDLNSKKELINILANSRGVELDENYLEYIAKMYSDQLSKIFSKDIQINCYSIISLF